MRKLQLATIGVIVLEGSGLIAATFLYLAHHPSTPPVLAITLATVGGVGLALVIQRVVRTRRLATSLLALLLLLATLPPVSAAWPGGITHARFGLTVVGAMPVPVFDISIRASGIPWFRVKTHRVSIEELRAVGDGAEFVIIGTGWDGAVIVDPEVLESRDWRVEALRTPSALERYHELRRTGRAVALILHSTC